MPTQLAGIKATLILNEYNSFTYNTHRRMQPRPSLSPRPGLPHR